LADLEATLDVKEAEVRDSTAEAEQWKMTTEALEKKLQAAEDLNKSLKEEIERLKVEQPSYSGESVLWKTKYLKLDQDHGALQGRLAQQQELTDEVRRQGQDFLEEMRAMAEEGGNPDREQKLQADVTSLEEEVKEWKARYVRAKHSSAVFEPAH